jgi:hypothetical protein
MNGGIEWATYHLPELAPLKSASDCAGRDVNQSINIT